MKTLNNPLDNMETTERSYEFIASKDIDYLTRIISELPDDHLHKDKFDFMKEIEGKSIEDPYNRKLFEICKLIEDELEQRYYNSLSESDKECYVCRKNINKALEQLDQLAALK